MVKSRRTRKYEAIDLMKLHALGSHNGWNEILDRHYLNRDVDALVRMRYGIQAGMADLAKTNQNSPKMIQWFIRLQKSIENTLKAILRVKYPNPFDKSSTPEVEKARRWKLIKQKRDHELELFFKKSGY